MRKVSETGAAATMGALSLRCPYCKHQGSFAALPSHSDLQVGIGPAGVVHFAGHRRCPNTECTGHIFVVVSGARKVVATYPPERLDFDAANLPANVGAAMEEAITCHANKCFVASAMLIRKTLELLCADKKATGDNLKKKVAALRNAVVLPEALLTAADSLRLLGNDAAHIDADTYNSVGPEEVEAAIALTKEILKSVYQYEALLKQLQGLQKKAAV